LNLVEARPKAEIKTQITDSYKTKLIITKNKQKKQNKKINLGLIKNIEKKKITIKINFRTKIFT
jgi:hypothetical protein